MKKSKKILLLLVYVLIFQNVAFADENCVTVNNNTDCRFFYSEYEGRSLRNDNFYKGDTKNDFAFFSNAVDVTSLSSYNSDEEGYITSVKDQGSGGNCWAFAATAHLESFLVKNKNEPVTLDLSENHIKDMMISATGSPYGYDFPMNKGGTSSMAISYFMNGCGPVTEENSSYENREVVEDYGILANYPRLNYAVNSVATLPSLEHTDRIGFNETKKSLLNKVKKLIYENGSVVMSCYASGSDYKQGYNIFYTESSGTTKNNVQLSDHDVCVVGWNDEYSKGNFKAVNGEYPEVDGALIVKNSWGESAGEQGYFYISYCDYYCCDSVYSILDIKDKSDCSITNTHTGSYFLGGYIGYSSPNGYTEVYYGNVFTKNYSDEKLEKISLYMFADQKYDIYLRQANVINTEITYDYQTPNENTVMSICFEKGTIDDKLLCGDFSPEYDGYYTLPLEETFDLTSQNYAIYIKTTNSNGIAKIPFESDTLVLNEDRTYTVHKKAEVNPLESFYFGGRAETPDYEVYYDTYYSEDKVNFEINAITTSELSKSKIDYMSIVDTSNQRKTSFTKGENVKIAPVVDGINLQDKYLYCCVYDSENRLVKLFEKLIGNKDNVFSYENIPENFENYEIRAFVFDSLDNITPLGNVKIYGN